MAKVERISQKFSNPPKPAQIADSESESDQEDDSTASADAGWSLAGRAQVIHSGHFMVSSPHSDSLARRRRSGASADYDFDTVSKPGCHTYSFGPFSSRRLSIDPTLTRLFECMTLAYSGKIVSPKWKSFKGLRLLWRDKIRLNNGIWRAWFIQYVEKRKNPVCGFVTPLEGSEADAHRKPEAIVLEGSYWKRRIEVVIKEYHKWRIYYKKRKHKDLMPVLQKTPICRTGLEKWSNQMYPEPEVTPEEVHMFDLDCFLSDISDTLFTMTQKPCPWSGDRHNTYTSNADMIQPGLTPLQPNLDDFMDTPDIFVSYRGQSLEQSCYADCGFFENSSSAPFSSSPSTVGSTALMHTGPQLTQPTAESLSQPSTAVSLPSPGYLQQPLTTDMTFDTSGMNLTEPKFKGHSEYGPPNQFPHSLALPPHIDSYGQQQSFSGPGVAVATSHMSSTSMSQENPYLYPASCLRYRHPSSSHSGASVAVTSTVITHTGSAINVLPQDPQQGQGYPSLPDMLTQSACVSLGYQPMTVALPPAAMPSPGSAHCFSMPQQMGRGKHKQKTGRAKGFPTTVATSATPPAQTSCLAKLLSSGSQERKPTLGFDAQFVGSKGHRPTSPSSASTSSMSAGRGESQACQPPTWPPAEILPLAPLQTPILPQTSSAQSSTVSSLLTQRPPLLIPKTEKLSPIQIHTPERTNSLTVSFSGNFGPTSPTNPSEKSLESSHTLPGVAKTEPNRTDTRRITHISAEQKRRFNIKLGFDTLHSLVTTLSSQPSIKISKATTLQKTAEYISKMQQERAQLHEEAQRLRDEILVLNSAINVCQQQLPATGVPITRQRFDHMREKFREYVRAQTLQNWKFWIFSVIMEPLFESYNSMVSTASVEDLCRTTLSWLDQHCSLPALRPTVLSSLRLLSTSTSILTDPSLVPEQATQAVTQGHPSHSYSQQHPL
ncbi:carbohydrate-responsive element-binding protein-like isoform X2 [Colossoma macropomum]|uniref:carbohydrate-responsive element-binding protein-like isoform X2 n=1 Tax=Colossoma macropomum TaxID=42526 RepID=UPI001864B4EF|nr:carbohydrate-responsive element-binding protein-like isoform X2 [Colossoma macropomum]